MTRAGLAKLLILVILAFIICLPEFFTLYRASKVNFHCLPYRPCERGNQVKKTGENGRIGDGEIRRNSTCDPSQTSERKKWEQACIHQDQSNTTDLASEQSWFVCETDMDMAELQRNISDSALKVYLEVSVTLQLRDAQTVNLTLYGLSNHSSLHLHLPEDEEEEKKKDGEEQRKAFYCCLPAPPTSEPANQSRCLLWFANQTVLTATEEREGKEKLPWKRTDKDEWQCMFRVLWLVLLCVVFLTIVTTVLGQIYRGKCSCKKPMVHPVHYNFTDQRLNDGERHTHTITPKGMFLHSDVSRSWSELSAILEVDSQDEIETLLDGNVDQCYTANLHHRSHPSSSSSSSPSSSSSSSSSSFSLTEEQAW